MTFLPTTKAEFAALNIDQPDFIVVSPEAYVDHPSFAAALIGRLCQSQGFSVAMLCQPVSNADFLSLGKPKHAFLLSCGAMDSMVANYSVSKQKRKMDYYSDEGRAGLRPDRVCQTYSKSLKKHFPNSPIVAGGLEPSLRRFAHYDYWSDTVMPSILHSSPVDLIVYGMGEAPLMQIFEYAKKSVPIDKLKDIAGTAYLTSVSTATKAVKAAILDNDWTKFISLSSFESVANDKLTYLNCFLQSSKLSEKGFIQKQSDDLYAVINRPAMPISTQLLDSVAELPFVRAAHPKYKNVPAIEEVQFSITAHRGCFGNCSFCALNFHQGKHIVPRSDESILREVLTLTKHPNFKGYIHDVGGPSANFHQNPCKNSSNNCIKSACIGFEKCPNLKVDHSAYLNLLSKIRAIEGVKKVFVRSGVRFDYCMYEADTAFLDTLAKHHVSGQLKVAPEHISDNVLKLMNKPPHKTYLSFAKAFEVSTKKAGLEQYLVPYFMSSHPGCTVSDAVKLTEYLISIKHEPEQVQDFYPTPGTLSTAMYYTGLDKSGKKIFVAKTKEDKAIQRALLQYRRLENKDMVIKALKIAKREDLIQKIRFKSAAVSTHTKHTPNKQSDIKNSKVNLHSSNKSIGQKPNLKPNSNNAKPPAHNKPKNNLTSQPKSSSFSQAKKNQSPNFINPNKSFKPNQSNPQKPLNKSPKRPPNKK
ncbi:MAG: YgiQ family radical SAM protein [Firmicutes bacterium]|nr:YgiQ family radical SAM protein [Bacillota bacterium]